jgi:heat shock protein HslJ
MHRKSMVRTVVCVAGALWLTAACQLPRPPSADRPASAEPPSSERTHTGPVRATGNEPGWVVEIAPTEITLILDYGERRLSAPVAVPERGAGVTRYRTEADGSRIELTLRERICADTMTGMPYPYEASLMVDSRELQGCGGDPEDLLTGGEWRVTGIGGRSVAGESPPTLEFTAGGGLSGSGSCNRYAGSYALSGEGLSISGVAATRMACAEPTMNQEQRFFAALSAVYRFEIAADGSLILHAVDGRSISATR